MEDLPVEIFSYQPDTTALWVVGGGEARSSIVFLPSWQFKATEDFDLHQNYLSRKVTQKGRSRYRRQIEITVFMIQQVHQQLLT
jgi:hypothetical protein